MYEVVYFDKYNLIEHMESYLAAAMEVSLTITLRIPEQEAAKQKKKAEHPLESV